MDIILISSQPFVQQGGMGCCFSGRSGGDQSSWTVPTQPHHQMAAAAGERASARVLSISRFPVQPPEDPPGESLPPVLHTTTQVRECVRYSLYIRVVWVYSNKEYYSRPTELSGSRQTKAVLLPQDTSGIGRAECVCVGGGGGGAKPHYFSSFWGS